MSDIANMKVAILATDGFEQSELLEPQKRLKAAGADVVVVSPKSGSIRGWNDGDWDRSVQVDMALADARVEEFDALVLPGGQINPDLLRVDENAVALVRDFFATGKPLAAICHGPWLLIEAGVMKGRRATSYKSIATDMKNAGAQWEDSAVVTDQALITSRDPGDLAAFCDKIIEELKEGRHRRDAA